MKLHRERFKDLVFQSPKGRLQTGGLVLEYYKAPKFQSPKGRLQTEKGLKQKEMAEICFNPQREGYKQVGKLDFIISTLCTAVNVFILIHAIKTGTNLGVSKKRSLSNLSVYPAAARNPFKPTAHKYETEYKPNSKNFAPEVDRYDFWSKCIGIHDFFKDYE